MGEISPLHDDRGGEGGAEFESVDGNGARGRCYKVPWGVGGFGLGVHSRWRDMCVYDRGLAWRNQRD